MGDFSLAEALVNFASGSEVNWNNFNLAIPSDIIIYTTDTKKFKRGDGVHRYTDLPNAASITNIASGTESLVNVLVELLAGDSGKIIIIDNEMYKPSATQLTDVMNRITAITNTDIVQTANMDTITNQFYMVDTDINGADDGKLVITTNHQMTAGALPETVTAVVPSTPTHLLKHNIYDSIQCNQEPIWLYSGHTYYYLIEGCHDSIDTDNLSFGLVCDATTDVTIIQIKRGLFKIVVGSVQFNKSVIFTPSVTYNAETVSKMRDIVILGYDGSGWIGGVSLISTIYGGTSADYFEAVAIDSSNNIICAGRTNSEGGSSYSTLVVKFDSNLNILVRKIYGGANSEEFKSVAIDSNDNIICAGSTQSEGTGNSSALVVKFDSNLVILVRKVYSGTSYDYFEAVTTDSSNNIICVGNTYSEGAGSTNFRSALVVKFNSNLAILIRKTYSGTNHDYFHAVTTDSSNNIICVGRTSSEGAGGPDALVVKFDSNLVILVRKIYGGTHYDYFYGVAIDSSNNIICVGSTQSEGIGSTTCYNALVVKFDSNLVILVRKIYGGTNHDYFYGVAIDSSNNIICVGSTQSEGVGSTTYSNALIVKFDSDLSIMARKIYSGSYDDYFYEVAIDSNDNIICAGSTAYESLGNVEAMVVKLPMDIPSGTFVGTILTGLTLTDSNLTLDDSTLTLADSSRTLANSALTLTNSALTLANSTLTQEKEDFGTGGFIFKDIIVSVYGGTNHDYFYGVATDSSNNIICVGSTQSEGVGSTTYPNALVVKFDSNLNILARKIYSGSNHDLFHAVAIDSSNNIICAGRTNSEGVGSTTYPNALVVKFDSNLVILVSKIYSGSYDDYFHAVAIDSSDNIICVGSTQSEGIGSTTYLNALVVKFDSNLVIVVRKIYSGSNHEYFYAVAIDSSNNIICVGRTNSEGVGSTTYPNALVVKFNSDLVIIVRKIYGGSYDDLFHAVAIDSSNNIICVGRTSSEGTGGFGALVVKFDSNLVILVRKVYGGSNHEYFYGVAIDSSNNIICVGNTISEGTGSPTYPNALVVKFDSNLVILACKVYGGSHGDYFHAVAIDSSDNIICVGSTASEGVGSTIYSNSMVIKLPMNIPSGTFVGTTLTGLTLIDSSLTLVDSALALSDSALTLADSALTLTNSALTLANSALTQEKETIQP